MLSFFSYSKFYLIITQEQRKRKYKDCCKLFTTCEKCLLLVSRYVPLFYRKGKALGMKGKQTSFHNHKLTSHSSVSFLTPFKDDFLSVKSIPQENTEFSMFSSFIKMFSKRAAIFPTHCFADSKVSPLFIQGNRHRRVWGKFTTLTIFLKDHCSIFKALTFLMSHQTCHTKTTSEKTANFFHVTLQLEAQHSSRPPARPSQNRGHFSPGSTPQPLTFGFSLSHSTIQRIQEQNKSTWC